MARGDIELPSSVWGMAATLDDVSCLLHLLIDGMLLSHESMTRVKAIKMMVEHLGLMRATHGER